MGLAPSLVACFAKSNAWVVCPGLDVVWLIIWFVRLFARATCWERLATWPDMLLNWAIMPVCIVAVWEVRTEIWCLRPWLGYRLARCASWF